MLPATLDSLLNTLKKHKYDADIQKETQQVVTILKNGNRDYPLFVRVFDESELIQILMFIPVPLNPDKVSDMGRLLHLLNKEIDLPGFGMDEMSLVIFYRLMVPATNKKIDENLFMTYIKSTQNISQLFSAPLEAVALGQASLDDILRHTKDSQSKAQGSQP